jgi:hypothetical protein
MLNRSRLTAAEAAASTKQAILEAQERSRQQAENEQSAQTLARRERERRVAAFVNGQLVYALDAADASIQTSIANGANSVVYQLKVPVARAIGYGDRVEKVHPLYPEEIEEQRLCAKGLLGAMRSDYEQRGFAVEDHFIPSDVVTIYGSGSDPIDEQEVVAEYAAIQISWPEVVVSGGAEN